MHTENFNQSTLRVDQIRNEGLTGESSFKPACNEWMHASKANITGRYNWSKPAMVTREHYWRLELLPWHGCAWPGIADDADDGLERRPPCPPVTCGRSVLPTVTGISSNLAIICILRCRARSRPLTRRCRAAMQRMWSSKMNRALNSGRGGGLEAADAPLPISVGRSTFTCRHRLSSLSPVTSTSCHRTSLSQQCSKHRNN